MVISVNHSIGQDCQHWIDALRAERGLLTGHRSHLQELVEKGSIPHAELPAVDHFDNQFEIQLSNVNHLKHAIKDHIHSVKTTPAGQLSAPHLIVYESLSDQFLALSAAIERLMQEFTDFCEAIQSGKQNPSISFQGS